MLASLKPGVTLAPSSGPVIETPRLRLRQWRSADIAPYTAMLADPPTARFITVDGKPVLDEMTGWRHTVVMASSLALPAMTAVSISQGLRRDEPSIK